MTNVVETERAVSVRLPRHRLALVLRSWPIIVRLVRYGAVSAVSTALSMTMLSLFVLSNAVSATTANLMAQCAGIPVSYALNRRWVWGRRDSYSFWRETAPFGIMSLTGLVLSTVAVHAAGVWTHGAHGDVRAMVVVGASSVTYGALWFVEFLMLEKWIFRDARTT
jgi:putative flippase GtrA